MPLALFQLQHVLDLVCVVNELLRAVIDQLHIWLRNTEIPTKDDLFDREDLRVEFRVAQEFVKITNILDLARLGHPIAFFLKALTGIVLHHFFFVLKHTHKKEEAAYYCSCASLAVVTVEDCHSVSIHA